MIYFIYKTTNLVNLKFYIGKHRTCNIDDGYLGSGKLIHAAIKKYGRENFVREILFFCESDEQLLLKEREIVNEDLLNREDNYNMILGGYDGANAQKFRKPESIKRVIEQMAILRRGQTKETNHSLRRISEQLTGRTKKDFTYLQSMSDKLKGRTKKDFVGLRIAGEKISVISSNRTKRTCPGRISQAHKMMGENNPSCKDIQMQRARIALALRDPQLKMLKKHDLEKQKSMLRLFAAGGGRKDICSAFFFPIASFNMLIRLNIAHFK